MLQEDSSRLIAELNRVIQKRDTVNNSRIRDWEKYKFLTLKLTEARNAIQASEEGDRISIGEYDVDMNLFVC